MGEVIRLALEAEERVRVFLLVEPKILGFVGGATKSGFPLRNMKGSRQYRGASRELRFPVSKLEKIEWTLRHIGKHDYWHGSEPFNLAKRSDLPHKYYFDLSEKAAYHILDRKGVAIIHYGAQKRPAYNPVHIIQHGLGLYEIYLRTGDPDARRGFTNQASWLLRSQETKPPHVGMWPFTLDIDQLGLKSPWYSAMAQGEAISFLLRVYLLTKDESFLKAALRAFQPFLVDQEQGGLTTYTPRGNLFLEDCPCVSPPRILNHFIYAILALSDLHLVTGEALYKGLFDRTIQTVLEILPEFDAGFWSFYSLNRKRFNRLSTPFYQHIHIEQLKALHFLSGEAEILKTLEVWQKCLANPLYRSVAIIFSYLQTFLTRSKR